MQHFRPNGSIIASKELGLALSNQRINHVEGNTPPHILTKRPENMEYSTYRRLLRTQSRALRELFPKPAQTVYAENMTPADVNFRTKTRRMPSMTSSNNKKYANKRVNRHVRSMFGNKNKEA